MCTCMSRRTRVPPGNCLHDSHPALANSRSVRNDGEYWFASRTLDANQRASSQGPLQPELRVVVDTVPPQIEFAVRTANSGEVMTNWQAVDQNLLATSLKVEYQDGAGQPWKLVAVQPPTEDVLRTNYQGQMSWLPETRSPAINIRVEVRDRAGNLAVVNRRLLLPVATAIYPGPGANPSARLADPFARAGQPSEGAVAWPSDNSLSAAVAPASGPRASSSDRPSRRSATPAPERPRPVRFDAIGHCARRGTASRGVSVAVDAAGPTDPRPTQPTTPSKSATSPADTARPPAAHDPAPSRSHDLIERSDERGREWYVAAGRASADHQRHAISPGL